MTLAQRQRDSTVAVTPGIRNLAPHPPSARPAFDAFTAAGFRIAVISEPQPVPAARELFPDDFATKPSFLCFLFFVLQAG